MEPHNQPGRPMEQSMQGGQSRGQPPQSPPMGAPSQGMQQRRISEMDVSTPTLRRVSIDQPQAEIPIGPDDYVLDSIYNHQIDVWEVLVLVQPMEDEEDDE